MNKIAAYWLAAALAASAAAPAFADTISYVEDGFVVSYSDLDLSTAEGQGELARRIETATDHVCRIPSRHSLAERQSCRRRVAAVLAENADQKVLYALAAAQSRRET